MGNEGNECHVNVHVHAHRSIQVHATLILLTQQGLMSTDELRRAMESLPGHKTMSYYHRWSAGMITVSLERGTITQEELNTECIS